MMQLLLTRIIKLFQVVRSWKLGLILLRYRVLAGAEHRPVLRRPLKTVVDVGANRGQFSLAVRRWAPGARVIGFEPLTGAAARFRRVFKRDGRVTLHQAAIGPKGGENLIHVSSADDSSSLLPISKTQELLYPGTGEVGTETVRVGRLAEFLSGEDIKPPGMLKVDVQGFELETLKGCEDLLGRFSQVYVECSFIELYKDQALAHEVIAWLAKRGFFLSGVYNISYDRRGLAIQGDFLFTLSASAF